MYQHPVFVKKHGKYTWCLHCERVYLTKDWVKNDWDCPGKGCVAGL
jgi:PHP family Zn ribbon phosphoesterase